MGGRGHLRPLSVCRREVLNEGVWYEQRGALQTANAGCLSLWHRRRASRRPVRLANFLLVTETHAARHPEVITATAGRLSNTAVPPRL
jgi:hypothetical protein